MQSYKDLDVFKEGMVLFYEVHRLSLKLPDYEKYELGSQIRRSADSVVTNIVEGYGRRRYKADFIRFLFTSYGSCLETINHIEKIKTLYPKLSGAFDPLFNKYDQLGAKIYSFIKYVQKNWRS